MIKHLSKLWRRDKGLHVCFKQLTVKGVQLSTIFFISRNHSEDSKRPYTFNKGYHLLESESHEKEKGTLCTGLKCKLFIQYRDLNQYAYSNTSRRQHELN